MIKLILSLLAVTYISNANAYNNVSFKQHIKQLKTELTAKGYDATILDKVFNNNFIADNSVKKSLKNQPEVKLTFDSYVNGKLTDWRIKTGRNQYKKNEAFLKQLEATYKVDPAVVIALWGVETNFGTYPLGHNAFKALANISYTHSNASRREFFKNELFDLFEVAKQNNLNPIELKSSWAGALGQCQFMPSNVLKYAKDGNNDGKVDIWNTEQDVFASAANFVNILGWEYNATNIVEVTVPKGFNILEKREFKSVAVWKSKGLKLHEDINPHNKMKLFAPENDDNKVYLVSKNLDVIRKWNNSYYFAFSVLKLADEIKKVN